VTAPDRSHLATEVQRFGLLSAAAVVDRYRHLVDRSIEAVDAGDTMPGGLESADSSWLIDRASRLAGGYLRFLESAISAVGSRSDRAGVERVALSPTPPGGVAEGSLWLHNPTDVATSPMQLTATCLVDARGTEIGVEGISFDPPTAGPVAPGGMTRIRVRVAVPAGADPGRYFGLTHVAGSDVPLVLDLEVKTG
jgi:hypothetical protein